jgi:hypothetical protein
MQMMLSESGRKEVNVMPAKKSSAKKSTAKKSSGGKKSTKKK